MDNPKVSVIVPCYNCESTVDACLDSLYRQTYQNIEIIVVNDGSTDGTLSRLNLQNKNNPKILVIDIPNGGVSNARNVAIKHSTGDYIAFLDSDDTVSDKYLSDMVKHADCDLVVSGYRSAQFINGGGKSIVSNVYCDTCEYLVDALKAGVFGFVWGKLYKRAVLEQNKILMNTQYANFEDEDFNLRYLLCCKTVQTLSVCNYIYCEPEYGKSYRSTDYMQQSILFLTSVKQMKKYEVYKAFINTWLANRFLMGALQNLLIHSHDFQKNALRLFKKEYLPYISKCRIIVKEKRKRAILLNILLKGKPSMFRIWTAFVLVNKI